MFPFISVIIPTYERESILCESIASVLEQDYPHFELLVVDQTKQHHPDTETYLQELDAIGKIRWLRVDWASLPKARNYGVSQSKGEIVLFLDDDVQLPPGFLAAHAKNYDRPEVGAVAGRVFDRMKLADAQPGLTIEDLPPEAMNPGIAWYHIDLVHTVKPQQVITARGCNMSFRKTLFTQHGIWFDQQFRGSAVREESDFCLRIRQTGLIIWYDPEAHLVHLGEENGGCHDISTRSLQYQISFYHNHFLLALKNLTFRQGCHLAARLFDCHVLGHPPCYKSTSPLKVLTRALFYTIGFLAALLTHLRLSNTSSPLPKTMRYAALTHPTPDSSTPPPLHSSTHPLIHPSTPHSPLPTPHSLKILILSHTYTVPLNCEKLRSLSQLEPGIEVVVVVPKRWQPGGVQQGTIESQAWEDGSFRVVPVANWSQNHQGLLCFGLELVTLLLQFRPQVIQVEQGSRSIAYAQIIILNKLLGLNAKLLFFTWWNLPYTLKPPVSWLEQFNLRHSHGIIAGNQDGAEVLRQQGYRGKIQVMPQLGVDETLFSPKPQANPHCELAARLGIQPQDFVVGYVGRFVPEKGLLTLCDALGGIHPEFNWKWLLVGRGDLKAEIQGKAQTLGIGDRLIWIESIPHAEIPNYLHLMHTLVLPSETSQEFKTLTSVGWKEQFGHVLIEAMACRVPVIGSNSGEIPFVIGDLENGDAGLIFPEGNAEILRDRLTQLMTQPELARSLGQKGYDRAMLHYTNRALAKQQLEFYRQLD